MISIFLISATAGVILGANVIHLLWSVLANTTNGFAHFVAFEVWHTVVLFARLLIALQIPPDAVPGAISTVAAIGVTLSVYGLMTVVVERFSHRTWR